MNNANNKDHKFVISNERNNVPISPPNYYEMRQQIETLFQWYDFKSIVFTTHGLPVRHEFITLENNQGESIYQPIVTDFIPEVGKDRSDFIYNADPYRLIDCKGHGDLYKFDFQIYYVTKNNELILYPIPPKFQISCKFAFIRKEDFKKLHI